jgi:hypothetical protein
MEEITAAHKCNCGRPLHIRWMFGRRRPITKK